MGKHIVVLTGSPRNNGNSAAMADAFIRRAQALGHQVTRFDAAQKTVYGCRDCKTCYRTGKACSFDDDFNALAPEILAADVLVFVTPVYWYTFPAQLKAVIDKLFAFYIGGKDLTGKAYALIACCEDDDITAMDGVRLPLRRSADLLGWKCIGEVLVQNVHEPGDIDRTDGCARAAALAEQIR